MTTPREEMIDVVFALSGETLPAAYHSALWDELVKLVPQLGNEESVGVVPLRMAESKEGMLLPKRAKLVLRVPKQLAEVASGLTQRQLQVANSALLLGASKTRPIQPYSTLHAQLVIGADDEIAFVAEIEAELAAMNVSAKLICGQHHTRGEGARAISGYSLVLHDLTPQGSLRVQCAGLGIERRFGCGVFIPYKAISGLE